MTNNNEKKIKEQKIKEQKILCITACALISSMPITSFINDLLNLFVGNGFVYDTIICYGIFLALIIRSLLIVLKNIKKDVLIFSFFLYLAWEIAYSMYASNRIYMIASSSDITKNPFFLLFVCAFTGYVFSRYISDFELFENIFLKSAVVVVVCSTISFFLTLSKDYQKQYMVFSYNMLVHVVFLIIYFFEHKNPVYLTVGIWGFMLMFMAGCRGALISCIGSLIVYLLFRKTSLTKKIVLISIMSILLYFIIANLQEIVSWIADVAKNLNIDSRTIKLIESGDFLYESGRDTIRERIIDGFNMLGHGLFGDRVLGMGSYAHNFIIEIIAQFGYIFGIPILVGVFLLLGKGLSARNKHLRNLIIIFLSAGFFKLFFSGSYLNQEPSFYILLGLCADAIMVRREENENTTCELQ